MRAVTREILDIRRRFCPVFSGNLGSNILEVGRRMPERYAQRAPNRDVAATGSRFGEAEGSRSRSPESSSELHAS